MTSPQLSGTATPDLTVPDTAAPATVGVSTLSVSALARMIDHAILDPQLSWAERERVLESAVERSVLCVFVPTSETRRTAELLAGTSVLVGAPIGFPHGSGSTASKVTEVAQAIADGADEIDVVQQIGWVRSGRYRDAEAELREIVAAADGRVVKSILEVAYLDDEQIAASSRIAEQAGVDFVKTSTGFAPTGATLHALEIMRANVGPSVQVKASHGVKSLDTVLDMINVGVTRFGMSATTAVLDDLSDRLARGVDLSRR